MRFCTQLAPRVFIAFILAFSISPPSRATIARQIVLGGQPLFRFGVHSATSTTAGSGNTGLVTPLNGSLWYDDDYNSFYNPAYINDLRDYAVIEKGFEGGLFQGAFENYVFGVYLNRGNPGGNDEATGPGTAYGNSHLVRPGLGAKKGFVGSSARIASTQRPIDIFVAGDTLVRWGAHLSWAYNRDESLATTTESGAEVTARYWHADIGLQVLGFEPFFGTTFESRYDNRLVSQSSTQELSELDAGVRLKYDIWNPYFLYRNYREEGHATAGGGGTSYVRIFGVGTSHDSRVADGVHILKNIGVWLASIHDDLGNDSYDKGYSQTVVPLNVALEAEALSWLTLRAGATYDFINQVRYDNADPAGIVQNRSQSLTGTTTFRLGSTIKLGKLQLDSAFGTGTPGTTDPLNSSSIGFDSQTFAYFSADYRW